METEQYQITKMRFTNPQTLIDRLKSVKLIDSIIIATTTNKSDDVICDLAKKKKVFVCASGARLKTTE